MKDDDIIDVLELSFLIILNRCLFFLLIIPFLILLFLSKWSGILMIPLSILGFFLDWEMRTLGKLIIGGILLCLLCTFLESLVSTIGDFLNNKYSKNLSELKSFWNNKDENSDS